MERTERDAVTDRLLAVLGDDAALDELIAAVEHAVTDGVDLIDRLNDAVLTVHEDRHNSFDGLLMGGHGDVLFDLRALGQCLVGQPSVQTDALAQTLGSDDAGIRVHKLILQARAAGVDNEDVHN